jgi:hypothetical protein
MQSDNEIIKLIYKTLNKNNQINWKKIWNGADTNSILIRNAIESAFPEKTMSKTEKAYRYIHNLYDKLICPVCNTSPRKFLNFKDGFSSVCSVACSNKSEHVKNKKKETIKKKYGVDNVFQSTLIKDKIKTVIKERYGVENISQSEKFKEAIKEYWKNITPEEIAQRKEKTKQTSLEKYGTEWHSQNQNVKDKLKNTCQEKYGSDNWRKSEIGKNKLKEVWKEKYQVENPFKSSLIKEKIANTLKEKYGEGVTNISHVPDIVEKRKQTSLFKFGRENPKQAHIPQEIFEIKKNKELCKQLLEKYDNNLMKLAIDYNVSYTWIFKCVHNHELFDFSRSWLEADFSDFLKKNNIKYTTNNRKLIQPYEIDFLLCDKNIGIELNGLYWHSELAGKDRTYHFNKWKKAKDAGIELFTIYDYEWINKRKIIENMLLNKFGISPSIYARKCKIVYPDKLQTRDFLNEYHIQGSINFSYSIGLEHDNELVAIMTFGKSRFHRENNNTYELLRFCSKNTIIGGMSKLFSHAIKELPTNTIISYADLRWGNGNSYENLGFVFSGYTSPNYFYFRNKHNTIIESRLKYQKHKLKNLLTDYDANKTEWENMKNAGYNRFWDCGNARYIFNRKI